MAKIQCKMCGGMLELPENVSSGECPYCGTLTTFPKISGEHQENLYNRAEHFRRINEYDKAVAAYEKIIEAAPDDPEAYWGLVLSRFGIEYVEDPLSHERIPTCHRVQFESILNDADYLAALDHAGSAEKEIYENEAKRIADIQKNILRVSNQEKPFDVFICYKETTDGGSRTKDSALAQDIYYQLTNAGYKVFFARITLESKLGQQYEPYIFAALNSAKVMLVIGSKKEYFEAVWVRNEWSRFLALMKKDRSKLLIPCYKDMDAYDIPDELSMFQAQDMGKIGFIQDLLHGIAKVVTKNDPSVAPAPAAPANIGDVNSKDHPFLQRAKLFLETEEFDSAKEYCEKLLDLNPQNGWAYYYRLMAENKVGDEKLLLNIDGIDQQKTFQLAKRFADNRLTEILDEIINFRIEEEQRRAEEEQNRYRKQLVCLCQRYSDRRQEEEQRRAEEEQRRAEEEQRRAEEEQRRAEEELKRRKEERKRREEEEQRFKKILLYLLLPIIGIVSIAVAVFIAFPYIRGYKSDGKTLIEVTDKNITEFTIPDGVTSIGSGAFEGCESLKSITVPDSVTSICRSAFENCSSLTSITIPDSVTSIGQRAFGGCESLKSITIPDSVTSIGSGAFVGCESLTSVTIPDSVTNIGNGAFKGCKSLKSVTIPDSVTSIGYGAFEGCSSLTSVTIPDSVTSIYPFAFEGCSSLTSITIPNSVTSIGQGAFWYCSSLTSITADPKWASGFPKEKLTSFVIPNGVTGIGNRAFEGCKSLKSVTIPDSVTVIGAWAFWHCSSLTSITIPDSVKEIGMYAFEGCKSLKSVTIPDSVTVINGGAFWGCSSLKSVTIPDSVTEIGKNAFSGCSSLTSITIPNSVTSIGKDAFRGCSSLKSVSIPRNGRVKSGAFPENCRIIRR